MSHPQLGQNIFISTLFLNTLSLCSLLGMENQISDQYKTNCKDTALSILLLLYKHLVTKHCGQVGSTLHHIYKALSKLCSKMVNRQMRTLITPGHGTDMYLVRKLHITAE